MPRLEYAQSIQLENQLTACKKQIELKDTIERLLQNRDFKTVVEEAFFVEETLRNVGLSGDPALSKEERADALAMAQAAGHLKRWFSAQLGMARAFENQVEAIENEIIAARAEEDAEDKV